MEDAGTKGNFLYQVEHDGVTFQHTLRYNSRDNEGNGAWYLTVANAVGTIIRAGIKLVINWPLLKQVVTEGRPAGELMVIDQRETVLDSSQDPDLDALGVDVLLGYIEEESMPQL